MTLDPPRHTRHRALAGKLFTPNRLKENEEFIWTLADELIDEFADRGEVEFRVAYARPFTLLVIADLLGVPREDHETLRSWLGEAAARSETRGPARWRSDIRELEPRLHPLIEERRAAPRDDVMSQLASVRFPDGELPEVGDIVRLAISSSPPGRRPRRTCCPRECASSASSPPSPRAPQRSRGDPELRGGVPAPRGAHQGLLPVGAARYEPRRRPHPGGIDR